MVIFTEPWRLNRENDFHDGSGGGVFVMTTAAGPIGIALTDEQWADFPLTAELDDEMEREAA